MRRFVSAIMIFCLLQVSAFGAVAKLADTLSSSHASVIIPADANPEPSKTLYQSILHSISNLKQTTQAYAFAFVNHPAGSIITVILGVATFIYGVICFGILADAWTKGVPFSIVYTNGSGGKLTSFAIPDHCINPSFMDNPSTSQLNLYQHLTQGTLSLTEVLPHWLNNAQNLMTVLGGIILQLRHHEHVSQKSWSTVQHNTSSLLNAYGLHRLSHNISCDVMVSPNLASDQIVNCQQEPASADLFAPPTTPDLHAKLLIIKWPNYGFGSKSIKLVTQRAPATQLYPNPDFSWDYGHIVPEMRTAARRILLQLNNPLPLTEALQAWLTNAAHWQALAAETATLLRQGKCPSTAQTKELNDLTEAIFTAHQALLTNGTVRCDMNVMTDSVDVVSCTPDTEPKDYDHTANCPKVNVDIPRDAAIWFMPNGQLYDTSLMIARQWVQTTLEPSTTPQTTTPAPTTMEPSTPQPTTAESTTEVTTLEPTTIPETTETTTAEPTTPAPTRPARNTTARLYWANWDSNPAKASIWWATINQTSGDLINPQLFVQAGFLGKIGGLHVDEENGFVYWGLLEDKGISRARLQTSPPQLYDNVTLLSTLEAGNVKSMYLEPTKRLLYWVREGQIYSATVDDPTNPTSLANLKKQSSTPITTCSLDGLYVNSVNNKLIAACQSSGINQFGFTPGTMALTNRTSMPPFPGHSTIISLTASPELGLIYMRDTKSRILGGDFDSGTSSLSDITPLVTNTTAVKLFGGMSIVPESKEWVKPTSRLYWANRLWNNIYVADLDPISGTTKNVRLFIDTPALKNPIVFYVNETDSTFYWSNAGGTFRTNFTNIDNLPIKDLSHSIILEGVRPSYSIAFDYGRGILLAQSLNTGGINYFPLNNLQESAKKINNFYLENTLNPDADSFITMTYDPYRDKIFFLGSKYPYRLYSMDIDRSSQTEWSCINHKIVGNSTNSVGDLVGAWIDLATQTLFVRTFYNIYTTKVSLDTYSIFANFTTLFKPQSLDGFVYVIHDD